ncbi:NmrA family NAD(P)-binding protein [Pendulispora albinea]|uniref:NmrA family NAD(P)-binding protein n=1 Tax=Pendulispora albinea TaxID=2741071 RepID=A0ABZ2M0C0_9BACT
MFVVAGVTGNTGAVVADTLLARGKKVRVVVRDASKGERFQARGAEVAVVSVDDDVALAKALSGAEGAYLLSPPDLTADDFLASRRIVADAAARAIDASQVPHVVFLSSLGAHLPERTGVVRSLHYAEQRLARTPAKLTFLRPSYFFENWIGPLTAAASSGKLPTFIEVDRAISMISSRDIGVFAAQALLEGPAAERISVINLEAPRDYTPRDIANAAARALERPVEPEFVPEPAIEGAFRSFGRSADVARLMRELLIATNDGTMRFENAGERSWRGTTDADTAVRGLLAK